jgi:hypothetical protein
MKKLFRENKLSAFRSYTPEIMQAVSTGFALFSGAAFTLAGEPGLQDQITGLISGTSSAVLSALAAYVAREEYINRHEGPTPPQPN